MRLESWLLIDNETKPYGTNGPNVQAAFVECTKRKYANPDNLDSAFGLGLMEQPYQFAGRFSIGQRLDQRQPDQCLRQVPTRIG